MLLDVIALNFLKLNLCISIQCASPFVSIRSAQIHSLAYSFIFMCTLRDFLLIKFLFYAKCICCQKKIKLLPLKVPQQLKFTIRCVMSWCSIESLLNRDINFQQNQWMRFRPVQQDVEQWGGWTGKVCVRCFTGKRLFPLRPFTLTDCFSLGACVH